jgi:tetratricopeptide (TPR) repeat protein
LAALVWRSSREFKWVAWGSLWILACLWPALNVRGFRETYLVHQRYLYLAVFGLCAMSASLIWEKTRSSQWRATWVISLIVIWSASTIYHHRFWTTDVALWERVVALDPANAAGWDWLGAEALAAGRVDAAEKMFRQSIAVSPGFPLGHRNLALLLHRERGQPELALPHYRLALERLVEAGNEDAMTVRRTELNIATCLAQMGEVDEAVFRIRQLTQRPPFLEEAYQNLAILELGRGRPEAAMDALNDGLGVLPGDAKLLAMQSQLRNREWVASSEVDP